MKFLKKLKKRIFKNNKYFGLKRYIVFENNKRYEILSESNNYYKIKIIGRYSNSKQIILKKVSNIKFITYS